MVERLWRSLKYECVYLHAFENGTEARQHIREWISFYNERRPHSRHQGLTPDMVMEVSYKRLHEKDMAAGSYELPLGPFSPAAPKL